jgi:hypothetical protein
MVKAYLRYELSNTWGVITSKSNICYDRHGKYLFTGSLERVAVWDVKQAILVRPHYSCILRCFLLPCNAVDTPTFFFKKTKKTHVRAF